MSRVGGVTRITRPKKPPAKQPIPIFRENQIDLVVDEPQASLQNIKTGVEEGEESEYHLQAAIKSAAAGKVSEAHIPTPETVVSSIQYDKLYAPTFKQPTTYIRFSSTVEDCTACSYDMDEEDLLFLKLMNKKRDASSQCSELQFEEVMSFFEETAHITQPYAAVDSPPVLSFDEMKKSLGGLADESAKPFAKDIHEHWQARRTKKGNRPLQPTLKFETGRETDDSDPYVCFRRREIRHVRKTRGRDAQSAEKLRRLRKELEDARELLAMVKQRERGRREMLSTEKQMFVLRRDVKEMKRKLAIKDDDDDLVNHKPKKQRPPDIQVMHRPQPAPAHVRLSSRPSTAGDDLQLLDDVYAEKENDVQRDIKQNLLKHRQWNEGFVDWTTRPITPEPDKNFESIGFRPAIATESYLPTPPSSEASGSPEDRRDSGTSAIIHSSNALQQHQPQQQRRWTQDSLDNVVDEPTSSKQIPFRSHNHIHYHNAHAHNNYHQLEVDGDDDSNHHHPMPSFRRRIGRGGRMLIDRRNISSRRKQADLDPDTVERWKYDRDIGDDGDDDDDDDDDYRGGGNGGGGRNGELLLQGDPSELAAMQYRVILTMRGREQAQTQVQLQQAQAQAQAQAHHAHVQARMQAQAHALALSRSQSQTPSQAHESS